MLGWLRRKKTTRDADIAEAKFLALIQQSSTLPAREQFALAYGVAFAWRLFNVKFTSADNYQRQSSAIQRLFLDDILKLQDHLIAKGDNAVARGVYLVGIYYAALLEGSPEMINRMADKLEPFNRKGSVYLSSGL